MTEEATEADPLAGWEETQISRGIFVKTDPKTMGLDGFQIHSNDGNWWVAIHECYDKDEAEQFMGYYDKILTPESNTDVDADEMQLGAYKYKTVTYTANAQYFGQYIVVFDTPIPLTDGYEMCGLSMSFWMNENTPEILSKIENIISTIEVRGV